MKINKPATLNKRELAVSITKYIKLLKELTENKKTNQFRESSRICRQLLIIFFIFSERIGDERKKERKNFLFLYVFVWETSFSYQSSEEKELQDPLPKKREE